MRVLVPNTKKAARKAAPIPTNPQTNCRTFRIHIHSFEQSLSPVVRTLSNQTGRENTESWGLFTSQVVERDFLDTGEFLPFLISLHDPELRLSHYVLHYGDGYATIVRPTWKHVNESAVKNAYIEVNVGLCPMDGHLRNISYSPRDEVVSSLLEDIDEYGSPPDVKMKVKADKIGKFGKKNPFSKTRQRTKVMYIEEHRIPKCVDWFDFETCDGKNSQLPENNVDVTVIEKEVTVGTVGSTKVSADNTLGEGTKREIPAKKRSLKSIAKKPGVEEQKEGINHEQSSVMTAESHTKDKGHNGSGSEEVDLATTAATRQTTKRGKPKKQSRSRKEKVPVANMAASKEITEPNVDNKSSPKPSKRKRKNDANILSVDSTKMKQGGSKKETPPASSEDKQNVELSSVHTSMDPTSSKVGNVSCGDKEVISKEPPRKKSQNETKEEKDKSTEIKPTKDKSITSNNDLKEKKEKPLSAYLIFCDEVRPKIEAENPGASSQELTKKIGDAYRALDADELMKYMDLEKEAKLKYKEEHGTIKVVSSSKKATNTKTQQPSVDKHAHLPATPAEGFPEGWLTRSVQRGDSGRKDHYWYSPKNNHQFRSRKEALRFIELLHSANGDEDAAFASMKNRKSAAKDKSTKRDNEAGGDGGNSSEDRTADGSELKKEVAAKKGKKRKKSESSEQASTEAKSSEEKSEEHSETLQHKKGTKPKKKKSK